jgi:hypothetical protein
MTSYGLRDALEGYCGSCHDYTGADPYGRRLNPVVFGRVLISGAPELPENTFAARLDLQSFTAHADLGPPGAPTRRTDYADGPDEGAADWIPWSDRFEWVPGDPEV